MENISENKNIWNSVMEFNVKKIVRDAGAAISRVVQV